MMRMREAVGRRVVSRDSAEDVGRVKRFLVDPLTASIAAIEITGGGRDQGVLLDWAIVVGFGSDAVVVPNAAAMRTPRTEAEAAFVAGTFDLEGKRVLTSGGDALGQLSDLEFDERTGSITRLIVGSEDILSGQLVAIGPYAVIVPG